MGPMSDTAKKTTIYDLAQLAGTSASTVSAVINGNWKKRRISETLAKRVLEIAEEHGFALNMQARALSRERSGIIGMIVPMYDNRYFSSIAQGFEARAREAGYFPIVTCTRRDPELEIAAARAMLGYQVELMVCCGATDPDRIHDLCASFGVPTLNLDLPGQNASSVISDNRAGAHDLTKALLARCDAASPVVMFIGGRDSDHNTKERIRGFQQAVSQDGRPIAAQHILPCGYAADKARIAYRGWIGAEGHPPDVLFVNSTISLEGILPEIDLRLNTAPDKPVLGCFDWDPFAARTHSNLVMVKQDVGRMLDRLFDLIAHPPEHIERVEIATILVFQPH